MAGKKNKRKQVHVKTPFSSPKPSSSHSTTCDSEVGLCVSTPADSACDSHPSTDVPAKMCRHLEKGIDVDTLSSKVSKTKFSLTHCQDCSKESKSGASKKGKGRSNRKKESAVNASSSDRLQKKWVCLACGQVSCGALPTHADGKSKEQDGSVQNEKDRVTPTGHVGRHSLCSRHPLALQTTDNLVWCFVCNMAADYTGSVDGNAELSSSSPLQSAVMIVQEKLVKETGYLKDPGKEGLKEDLFRFDDDHIALSNGLDSSSPPMSMHVTRIRKKRAVKGLMNLGNTCFFNSVMQNLLALDMLRDYFSQEFPGLEGPLSSSLRKLYLETNLEGGGQLCTGTSEPSGYDSGLKKGGKGRAAWENVGGSCNPRSLFGAICSKAPRFKGFQQQDSHELLRCLLDGLTSEERSARAKSTNSVDMKNGGSASATSQLLTQSDDNSSAEALKGEKERRSSEARMTLSTSGTFVESFFGGQLCSTVRCCDCGHSSIVFEPMLDLSLPIPNPKKGQMSANLSKPSSFGAGSQQRSNKQTKVLPKSSLHKVVHATDPAVADTTMTSLQGGQSSQEGLTSALSPADASSSTQAAMDTSDNFGWLDFISGGMQTAESCVQGSCDASNTIEVTESNLAFHSKDPKATIADDFASAEIEMPKDASESASSSAEEQDKKLLIDSVDVGTSLNSKEEEIEKPLALFEDEDGPLPLASGIVLLPYEPLEMSSTSRRDESIAYLESAPAGRQVDLSSPPTELEGGYLDGFSQLFEEEESYTAASETMKPLCKNLEDSQVIEESAWDDGSWEATVYGRSEAGPASQRSADVEDVYLPMSLEGCLADFTKTELLCGENAWECESCTRRMKEKESFLRSENLDNTVSIKDMNGGVGHEEATCMHQQSDSAHCQPLSCNENGVPKQFLPEGCEGTSGGDNGSIKGSSSSVCLVVDHAIGECRNDHGHHPVTQSPKVDTTVEGHSTVDGVADTPNLEQDNESGMQSNGDNTRVHSLSLKPSVEDATQKCCNGVKRSKTTTSRNKPTKIKSRQPQEKIVKKDATKKLSISKAPPVLTVHLKRFAQDIRGRLSKLSGHVAFPEILDLRPFLDPRCIDPSSCFYQLVGVVEHGGTMRGGHYIAYVRSASPEEAPDGAEQEGKDVWYYVSDSSVHKAPLQAVLNSEAYLLFYEKCNVLRENGSECP